MIRHLAKTIQRTALPKRDEIELCLLELIEVESDEDDESEELVQSIDRGGLKHVTNMTYMAFEAMEVEFRKHLIISNVINTHKIKTEIENNGDVQFYWCIASVGWANDTAHTILGMIINLWITIRGFSTASGWLEKYKQAYKRTVQKSKGVRKQLI